MATIEDYKLYLQGRDTQFTMLPYRLHLEMYINDSGRENIIDQLPLVLVNRWLDEIVGQIEDSLVDGFEIDLLRENKCVFELPTFVGINVCIDISHVSIRVVSNPPFSSNSWNEMTSYGETKELVCDELLLEDEEKSSSLSMEEIVEIMDSV